MRNSYICPLTGLLNRRLAIPQMERMCQRAALSGEKVGLLFLDLDRFQTFNDCVGHGRGDRMLFRYARVLEGCVEENTVLARFGGDEFVIAVPDAEITALLDLGEFVQARIGRATSRFGNYCGKYVPLTATIGVACFPDDGADAKEILDAADVACYAGKGRGGNCVVAASELAAKPA